MKRISVLTIGLAVVAAVPAQAQLANFPVYAQPTGAPATYLGATYGRGMNDASGKVDSYGAFVGRTGIGNRASIFAGLGMLDLDPDSEWTFGGGVAVDVLPAGGAAQVALQAGVGYFSPVEDFSILHFPIGVALKGMIEGPTADVMPWVMPRLSINRSSFGDLSDTSTDFGVSGGVALTLPSGLGFHTAIDLLATDPDNVWLIGVGVHYAIR
jgi:hypothetical protein